MKTFDDVALEWQRVGSRILVEDPLFRHTFLHVLRVQMTMMVDRMVPPDWENFVKFGNAWTEISKALTEEQKTIYEHTWKSILERRGNNARNDEKG